MALITTDRVKENASVVGFGDAVLIGSPAGFQTFSSVMDIGDTCYYSIVDTETGYWETGIGTLTSVNLLQRTAVKTSSFDDDKVSFTDGDKTISLALTSDQFLNLVAATLTQNDITSLVDARYVQFDNNIAQSVTGSGTFGVASSSGIYEASVVLDNALGVESSYSDDAYISTFNLRSNQSSWTVQDLVSSQNINVVLTSTNIDLFYNGNYSQTGNSLLTRSMMDARYQAVGDYLNTTWNGNVITGQYGGTGVANTGKTITIGGNLTTSGAFETTLTATANTSVILPTTGTLATLAGSETFTNKTLSTNTTWNGNIVTGQYGGTGIANTGKTITIGGNLTTSGAFTTTLASTANTSVTLPTTGTLATLDGSETFTNKTLSTNTTWNGNVLTGQYGGTGVANTGRTITIGGNLTTSGAFDTTLTATANTSVTLPTTGALATLDESETLTNKTLSINTTWNGNIITGQYGGTGVANTGKTITIGGNLTTTGAFTTAITSTANTNVTLPTTGTLATLDGSETFTNKTLSTNVDYNGNVVAGQYGGTGVANTGKTITIGGNLTTSGAFTTTLTATANTSVTLPTTGTLATLAGTESFSNKYITIGAGNTTVAGLILTSGTNTTAVANGSIEFDNTNFYFSVAGARKTVAYLDSNLTGTWSGTVVAGQYGGTGIANTGKTITIGGDFTTSGAFTTTLTATANTSVILPTTGTLATLTGIESFTNKTLSTNTTWNGNVIPGQYGGTGIANTGFTLTMAGNVSHAGAFTQTLTATADTSVTLPVTGTLATLAGIETLTNKTLSTNTTWNGNIIAGDYGGTGVANTGKTITIGGNLTTSGAFTTTLASTANTSVTLPTTGTLATLDGSETLTNKTLSTNTTWNGNIVTGQYGGTGVANTGKTITIGGNLTTSGAFTTTIASTANTSVTLPTTGTLATLAGSETLTNKTLSTNVDYNGNVVAGQYGGTGIANTGKTITIGGNLTTSGAFTTTLTATANTSVTLPTTGTLATLSDVDSLNTGSTAGVAWLWGSGADGRLGGNTVTNRSSPVQTIAGGTNWKQASCRAGHSAAIKTDGTLWLWGSGGYGQLGDGTTTNRSSPVQTITTGANWKNVSCGETHTAAIKTDGTLWTWGRNNNGQLGDNTTAHRSSPVQTIAGGTNWKQVSCGYRHTACVKTDGTLWLWGNNSSSFTPIGDNTSTNRSSPVQTITGGTNWSQVSCGKDFTAAIKTDGTLWTWGSNYYGQLGNGSKSSLPKSSPIQTITGGDTWTEISCGDRQTAAIKTDGTLWLWGQNTSGTLGDGTTDSRSSPIQTITGGNTWTEISCGYGSSAAIKTDGSLWLWGANSDGRLGDNTVSNRSSPIQTVTGGYRWLSVSIGGLTFAIASDIISGDKGGTGVANTDKTITIGGNLTTSGAFDTTLTATAATSVTLPTTGTLATLAGIESLTNKTLSDGVGFINTLGNNFLDLTSGIGIVSAWGQNNSGTLGDGTYVNKSSPVQLITSRTNWSSIATGGQQFSAGVKQDGTLWAWGLNNDGQLGDNTINGTNSPVQVITGGTNWKQVSCGYKHTAAIKTDGTLWTWGINNGGQLGDNTTVKKSSPIQTIAGGTNWSKVSCGVNHTGAIKTDGTLWSWGTGTHGALGDNSIVSKSSPVQTITGGNTWREISCGYNSCGAIKTDGTLWVWGYNQTGAVGDGTATNRSSPVQTITGGTNWSKITKTSESSGLQIESTAAIKTDGTLWTWGGNDVGQLGDNTIVNKSSPVQTIVRGYWSGVFMGGRSTIAIEADGTLWAWGRNNSGQLGDNTTVNKSSPVQTIAGGYKWVSAAISDGSTLAISANPSKLSLEGNLTTSGAFTTTLTSTANTSVTLPTTGTLATLAGIESFTNKTMSTNTTWNGNIIPGQYGGTGIANTGFTLTMAGNISHAGAFAQTFTATGTTSVTLPTTGTLTTLAGIESFTNKTLSTNTTWNGNVIAGQYGGTGVANTGKTITIGGNLTTSGAFTTTLTATANTSVTLPTTGTLATLAGTETFSNKTVNLAAGNATTAPLKFVSGTNMTAAAAGNMEFDGTRLYFSPSTTRQTVAFLTDITGGLTVADDTTTNATRYLIFTNTTSGSVSTANTSSSKLYFNPSTGDLTAGGSITALSDRTLKNNITTITGAVDKVNSMRGVEFDWIESGGHGIGMIAQEVEDIIPEVVLTHKGLKSVAYGNLIAVLIEAIKDQDKRIKLLEALVERLVK